MLFEALYGAAQRGELLLVDGGMCHYHLRQDGQLTIREIIVLPDYQRRGIGRRMLATLAVVSGAESVFAKVPSDLEANGWYEHMGFECEGTETTRTGRKVNLWRYQI